MASQVFRPAFHVPRQVMSSGRSIPMIGFGTGTTWFLRTDDRNSELRPLNESIVQGVQSALKVGFDHIDAAEMYGTERETGLALRNHLAAYSRPREDLFVTSKLWQSVRDVKQGAAESLKRLGVGYLDLYLLHAPFLPEGVALEKVWKSMEELVDAGLVKDIGVSNFRTTDINHLLDFARIKPVINQIEANPYLQQTDVEQLCKKHGIIVEAYSPLTPLVTKPGGPVDSVVNELAQAHSVTPAEILLRWSLQTGKVPITTSKTEERLRCFLRAAALPLDEPSTQIIDGQTPMGIHLSDEEDFEPTP